MDDNSFGPALQGHFDFTLKFGLIFFKIVPAIILLLALPFYLLSIYKGTVRARAGILLWVKLALVLSLVAVQAAILARFRQPYANNGMDVSLPAAASTLSFLSAIIIGVSVCVGHLYFCASPAFLGFFLTVTLLLDCATARSLSLRAGFHSISRFEIAVPVLKFLLVIMEEISKRSILRDKEMAAELGREAVAGFWSRSFFFWINGLLWIGFGDEVTNENIRDIGFDSEIQCNEFALCWALADKTSKFALLWSCLKTVPQFFLFLILPRLMSIGFNYSQPFLLQRIVNSISHGQPDPKVASALIGATALIYTGKSMCTSWYNSYRLKLRISVRGILIGALYNKSLKLTTDDLAKAAVLTLMSTDVNGILSLISLSYESWARLIEVGLGLGILAAFIGPSCIFTLIPAIISSIFSTFATKKMTGTRKRWNEHIEIRVAATSTMLSQIKDLKMTGLAPVIADNLQKQMDTEIKVSMGDRHARSITWAVCALVESMAPALVIGSTIFWTRALSGLSVADFFTILALTSMVTNPFTSMLLGLPHWATAWASVQRVQEYLCKNEREDYRVHEVGEPGPKGVEPSSTSPHSAVPSLQNEETVSVAARFDDVSAFTLQNTSFNIARGRKTMIRGAVGSGKSTILKALLGEVKLKSGTISVFSNSIAYCDQDPWILNTTIEENIVGNSPRDSARLWKVIRACALEEDVARLPDGILTLAGSEGCNLSGGQKQRVSLARGLFADKDILLLDDVFSALDIPTATAIRQRLFGEGGLLAQGSKTLVMATNIAQHLEDADTVLQIDANGQVQELPQTHSKAGKKPEQNASANDGAASEIAIDDKAVAKIAETTPKEENADQRRYGDLSIYAYFFRAAGLKQVLIYSATVVFAAIVERFPPIYARIWMGSHPDSRIYYIGYVILSFLNPFCNLLCSLAYFYMVNAATAKSLHRTLADTTSGATLDFLTKEDSGVLLNRFSQDISVATQELPLYVMPTSWVFFTIIIDIGVIAAGATYASPILPVFILLVYGIQFFYLRTSRQLRFLELDASKVLYKLFKESGKGVAHIRAFEWEIGFTKQLYAAVNNTQRPVYSLSCLQQWLSSVLSSATTVAAICVVTLAVKFSSKTSQAAIGLALLSLIGFSELVGEWINMWTGTETSIGAVSRTREFANSTPAEEDANETKRLAATIPHDWPKSGSMELENLSAAYQAKSAVPHTAFQNVTVSIPSGAKVGIVGRTGSGKSSLLLTILHLLEHSGVVRIDGLDIRRVPRNMLRSRITTITQSGIELPGSVRFNINPWGGTQLGQAAVTDDMIIAVLQHIGSGLWEVIESRGGLDAEMNKLQLSQGQKQLIQLARAVIHKQSFASKIVLVDEGSASLDQDSESRVQTLMDEEFRDCTVLTISHRPTSSQHADFFIRMTDGKAEILDRVEDDKPKEASEKDP